MADTFTSGLGQMKSLYGVSDPQLEEYKKLLDDNSAALKARYENPNWFNVAAGFLKPQLGGFAASLGSASQALGDWQEKQRANELPLAQMRAEIGMTNMVLGQRQGEAAAKRKSVEAAGPPGSAQRLAAEQAAYGNENVTTAGQGAGTTAQQNAKSAHDVALSEYARFKALPGGRVPQHIIDALSSAEREMAKVGIPVTPVATTSSGVTTTPSNVEPGPATQGQATKEYLPMSVKPLSDERASTATLASNTADAAKQNEDWNTYHSKLGKLVNTPAFQGLYASFDLVKGLNPRYVEEVTDLVNKHGGWAALLAKGTDASVSTSVSPLGGGVGAKAKIPLGAYYVGDLKPHLKETFDVLANNLGDIDNAAQNGLIPGMGVTSGGLDQSGRALWHWMAKGSILLDQAQFEHSAAEKLRPHINPDSITPMPDIYNSAQMRASRAAYNKTLANLNKQFHTGTVEKKP